MMVRLLVIPLGFLLDALLGDPHWLPHPVRWIGRLIKGTEQLIRPLCGDVPKRLRAGGAATVVLTLAVSTALPLLLLLLLYRLNLWAGLTVEALMCYQILAARSLRDESMKVFRALEQRNLPAARSAVSMIVGRDVQSLTEEGVTKAAVETVAENASDGVIAPLFYLTLGGVPLGFLYKAANTMDSMLGYRNERYLDFGRCAARLDDVLNFVPARLSALLMIAAAGLLRLDARGAWRIVCRDRLAHKSPNAAHTESACAGALGVQLAGDARYFGKLHRKPTIGDPLRPVAPRDIVLANRLMVVAALLMLPVSLAVQAGLLFLLQ